jgi:hypothetical protein
MPTAAVGCEELSMRCEKQKSKNFYRDTETGQLYVIERRWDGTIIGSCPAKEPLRDLDDYECTNKNNLWIQDIYDKLVLI